MSRKHHLTGRKYQHYCTVLLRCSHKDTCTAAEDACEKINSETSILTVFAEQNAQETCEKDGNCEFSYSVMAGGKKCAAAPSDPNVKVLSNPQDDAKMCYTRLKIEPCTCHKSQCSKVLTEKWVELGIILQSENRGEEEKDGLLDYFQFSLDIMGMIPGFGMVADAINTGIYGYREMWSDAVYSALAVVPAFGALVLYISLAGTLEKTGAIKRLFFF